MRYYFLIQIHDINAFHMPAFCKASFGSLLAYTKVLILNKILLILPKITKRLCSFQNLLLKASWN